jgi:hypothetical protein
MKGAAQAAVALVGHGADIGMKSREGLSALQYARKVLFIYLCIYVCMYT